MGRELIIKELRDGRRRICFAEGGLHMRYVESGLPEMAGRDASEIHQNGPETQREIRPQVIT